MAKFNLKVGVIGERRLTPKRRFSKPILQQDVIRWIKAKELNPDVEDAMLKKLMSYPIHTYHKFRENFDLYLEQIQRARRVEISEKISSIK